MKKHAFRSLSVSLPIQLFICTMVLMTAFSLFSVQRFHQRTMDEYTRRAEEINGFVVREYSGAMADGILGDPPDAQSVALSEIGLTVMNIMKGDVLYVFLGKHGADGKMEILFPTKLKEELPQAQVDPFFPWTEEASAGADPPGQILNTEQHGMVYVDIKPVLHSDGTYACSSCVVYSLDYLSGMRERYMIQVTLAVAVSGLLILGLEILLIRRRVTNPIHRLSCCAEQFSYATEEDRMNNIELLKQADIHSGDEIEDVYKTLLSVTRDSFTSTAGLNNALNDIQEKEEEITSISRESRTDKLTGLGNATAFRLEAEKQNKAIRAGKAEFGVFMFDMNNLKYINDTFGHEGGDQYIRGCSRVVSGKCPESRTFRTGGDEFVTVLLGKDYADRERVLREIREVFETCGSDEALQPWERYSASVGLAEFRQGDESFEAVCARADQAMYAEKEAYHRRKGRYR